MYCYLENVKMPIKCLGNVLLLIIPPPKERDFRKKMFLNFSTFGFISIYLKIGIFIIITNIFSSLKKIYSKMLKKRCHMSEIDGICFQGRLHEWEEGLYCNCNVRLSKFRRNDIGSTDENIGPIKHYKHQIT